MPEVISFLIVAQPDIRQSGDDFTNPAEYVSAGR